MSNWAKIKKEVEGRTSKSFFDGIPKDAPELEKCYSLSKKAAKVGFDWHSLDGVYNKVNEELKEVEEANSQDEKIDEIGDLLFTVVQLARKNKIKPQDALSHANQKFMKRFNKVVEYASSMGVSLEDLTDEMWNDLWIRAKEETK